MKHDIADEKLKKCIRVNLVPLPMDMHQEDGWMTLSINLKLAMSHDMTQKLQQEIRI